MPAYTAAPAHALNWPITDEWNIKETRIGFKWKFETSVSLNLYAVTKTVEIRNSFPQILINSKDYHENFFNVMALTIMEC